VESSKLRYFNSFEFFDHTDAHKSPQSPARLPPSRIPLEGLGTKPPRLTAAPGASGQTEFVFHELDRDPKRLTKVLLVRLGLSWSASRKIRRQLRNQELLKDTGDRGFTKSDEHA
jgi:hypothetical protein